MREKFQTRQIVLRDKPQVTAAISLISNLPIDAERPLEVVIREEVRQRGLTQNGYYWMRLNEIAEQGWFAGRLYSSEVWHEYAKKHIMPEEIITKDGVICSKWLDTPDGERIVISTTELEKGCFAEYTQMVEVFGAGLGVRFKEKDYE